MWLGLVCLVVNYKHLPPVLCLL